MGQIRTCLICAVFLTVLMANMSTGQAFRCWFCNSDTDPRCGDPFNRTANHRTEDCNPPYYSPGGSPNDRYVCRKVRYRRTNNEVAVARMCVKDGPDDLAPCSQQSLSGYLRVDYCSTCDTDLCNSAPTLFKVSSVFGPIILFLSKIYFV